jgi:hypothetical protein
VELIGGLPIANCGHIHSHQFSQIGGKAGGRAVPHLFIIADQQVRALFGFAAGIVHGLDCGNDAGHTGFIIQVARADKPIGYFNARIKSDKIAYLDSQRAVSSALLVRASSRTSMMLYLAECCRVPACPGWHIPLPLRLRQYSRHSHPTALASSGHLILFLFAPRYPHLSPSRPESIFFG